MAFLPEVHKSTHLVTPPFIDGVETDLGEYETPMSGPIGQKELVAN